MEGLLDRGKTCLVLFQAVVDCIGNHPDDSLWAGVTANSWSNQEVRLNLWLSDLVGLYGEPSFDAQIWEASSTARHLSGIMKDLKHELTETLHVGEGRRPPYELEDRHDSSGIDDVDAGADLADFHELLERYEAIVQLSDSLFHGTNLEYQWSLLLEAGQARGKQNDSTAVSSVKPSYLQTSAVLGAQQIAQGDPRHSEEERRSSAVDLDVPSDFIRWEPETLILGVVFEAILPEYRSPDSHISGAGSSTSSEIYGKINLWVVVQRRWGYVRAAPIHTYGRRGAGRKHVSDHVIVHTGPNPPSPMPDECDERGEVLLRPAPIRIYHKDGTQPLLDTSRLNLGRVYAIDHHTKVRLWGFVDHNHLDRLQQQLGRVDESWTNKRRRENHQNKIRLAEYAEQSYSPILHTQPGPADSSKHH